MTPERRARVASGAVLGAVIVATLVLLTPFCGLLHRCGCRPLWSGGESRCNYQNATGPHCPWCEHRALGGAVGIVIVAGEALAFAGLRRRGAGRIASALGALATFPVTGVVAGALAWAPTDYPHFLALDARARLGLPAGPIGTCAVAAPGSGCCPAPR